MDKQKQIEEMAIQEMARIFIKASCKGSECEKCLFIDSVKEAKETCVCLKAFYNAGYRKISKNEVVLTREEYQMLNYFNHRGEELLKQERKETDEKFSDRLKSSLYDLGNVVQEKDIDEILKEFTEGK